MSNEKKLVAGVVLASVGLRYSSYCSNVGRTILIDPSTNQQNYYKKLLALQEYLVSTVIKDGVSMKAVYEAAQAWLGENEPNLVQHLPKTLGFGTGIEYRDSLLVISAKNETVIKKDMTINLILGFQNLNENGKEYALLLADTLVVGDSSSSLISNASKDLSTNSYFFKASEDAEASPAGKSKKPVDPTAGLKKSKILNTRLRGESKTEEENGEQKRREHQRDLLETLIKEGTQRFSNKEDADANKEAEAKKIFRKYESYRGVAQYPSGISKNHIYVDRRQETIFLPLFGMSVPFHFNTLKNFSKSEEGEYTYLRFNFNTPGQTGTKKDEVLPYDDPNANFVRSFTFRSTDRLRYNDIYKQITDLKRDLQKKEQERRQKADLVEQDRLVEARRNLGVLSDVGIRPHLEGKRLPGDLHIHENGLRFVPVRGDQRLDILFGNIKHLIFQPCDHELYVILHCHLKNPIMVGKKKTKDVQFFKDASDMNYDETNNARRKRRTYGDEDELQAEQEERKRRSRLNKEFKAFAEKISEVSDIITDMPSRDLGFYGAVASSNVMFQPTESCLVQLSETPFTVIELGDVEIANLERVQFGSKYFDLVFVFKDFSKTPVHINSIAMKQLEHLKEWLDFANIFYLESPVALSWPAILKNIQSDPLGFYEDGAWQTLIGEEQDEAASSEEESASEYEVSGAESESEEDDESDYDEEDEESEEEESEFSDEDDSEEEEERPRKSDKKSSGKRSASQEDVRPKKKMK